MTANEKKLEDLPEPEEEMIQEAPSRNPSFPIVGIGASAGGLDAFLQLLRAVPADTGMGFVIVQHLAPSHSSALAEILSRVTTMPVIEVQDEPQILPNHVYVIPPNRTMFIENGNLALLQREPGVQHRSIDIFFRALASDQQHKAIGVILSGNGTDGTLGLASIKAEGGITFAQDESAQFDSMPRSAIAARCVDFVLAAHQIAEEITQLASHPHVGTGLISSNRLLTTEVNLNSVLQIVHRFTGVDFTHYKKNTLNRRVTRRMVLHKLLTLADYVIFLQNNPTEAEALCQDILINVTSFFRNADAFESLKSKVFPTLVQSRSRHEPLRLWVLGCSTGEEAYSIAMTYAEFSEASNNLVPLQIFATDLNGAGIEKARTGIYSRNIIQDVSPERLRRFFIEVDGSYRISKPIRDMCVFARHNVLNDPPFSRLDFVSCRNMLIYLDSSLQQKVLPTLHYALKPEGILWLGNSETIGFFRDLFDVRDSKHKLYAKKPVSSRVPVSISTSSKMTASIDGLTAKTERTQEAANPSSTDVHKEVDRILLARYVPPSVLVNSDMDILQFRGDTGLYLTPAPGKASLNLFKMAREGLLVGLRSAIHRSRKDEIVVREEGLRVRTNGGYHEISIEVLPVRGSAAREGCFLVLFEEVGATRHVPHPSEAVAPLDTASNEAVDVQLLRLTQELAATREYLQSVIEQQEAANEELQSANEEVQSSNEELQSINEELETSKEEIQSSNEELATVNDELQHRNQELSQSNNDLTNLLSSVQLAIVMLGPDLRIRRFTPSAEKMLNLIPADVGRPLTDIKLNLNLPDLEPLLIEVIDTVSVKEREIQNHQGHWYTLRIRPYKTLENKIDGAVIVLVDIDRIKKAHEYAESIIDTVSEPLVVLDRELKVQRASRSFYRMFGLTPEQTENRFFLELENCYWSQDALRQKLDSVRLQKIPLADFEVDCDLSHSGRRTVLLNARRLEGSGAFSELTLLTIQDITPRKQLEAALRQRVEKLDAADRHKNEFIAMLAHELRNPMAPLRHAVAALESDQLEPEKIGQAWQVVDRQINNMVRMIDDLLDVSRVTQNKVHLTKEVVELMPILHNSIQAIRPLLNAREQTLHQSFPTGPIFLHADSTRLEQVFSNLLDNASKFTGREGQIWLDVKLQPRKIPSSGQMLIVQIRDDGIGISPEMLPRVFDLFAQGDQSLERSRGGLGIGLTLLKRLVELHGGSVEAKSDGVGFGSELIISLPTVDDARIAIQTSLPTHESFVPKRILVVDDNLDAAESLAMLLRISHHTVQTAHDGQTALQTAADFLPEAILLDIGLPGMDGFQVAKLLRRIPGLEQSLLIALTGYGQEEVRRRTQEAGFNEHMTKPADPIRLAALLNPQPRPA